MTPPAPSDWTNLSDEDLLEKRIGDLGLTIAESELEECVQELHNNLEARNILFRPLCYLADEWFVMEGKSAIGIPFYLAHPRLKRLEHKMMLEVEGGTKAECMKLLRHEAGHAIFYAYKLGKKKVVHDVFGPSPDEPPESYRPKPYSKSFVRHLDNWYAQAEPDEDFAETFAVWLTPDIKWRDYYKGWSALKKLEIMDRLMNDIVGQTPAIISKEKPLDAARSKMLLKTFYQRKQKMFAQDYPDFYDRDLKAIFTTDAGELDLPLARDFMKVHRKVIVDKVARWTGEKKFILNNLMKKLIERCDKLKLKMNKSESETLLEVASYMSSMALNYIYTGRFKPTV